MSWGGKDHTGHKRFAPGARKRVHFSDPDTDTLARLGLRAGHGGLGDKSNGRAASGSSPSIALALVAGNAQIQGVVKRAGKGVTGSYGSSRSEGSGTAPGTFSGVIKAILMERSVFQASFRDPKAYWR
jgi:hypothetical protein